MQVMNDEQYVALKSQMVKSMFATPPPKGCGEDEFIYALRDRVNISMSFNETFFNDVNLSGKSFLDYYSSSETSDEEKSYFLKTFDKVDILDKFQFNKYHFFNFVSNIMEGVKDNNDLASKQMDLMLKIIDLEWRRDIDTLLLDEYKGKNVISHIMSYGLHASMMLKNKIENKKLTSKLLPDEKINFLKNNTQTDNLMDNLYFDLTYFSCVKNPNEANNLLYENKEIIQKNMMIDPQKWVNVLEKSLNLFNEDHLMYIRPNIKSETTKKTRKNRI